MQENPRDILRAFITQSFPNASFSDEEDLLASGFVTSAFMTQLVVFIEQRFGVSIQGDDLDMDNFRSIESMTNLIERKLGSVTE